jgi:UrcA family protein
MNTTNYQKSRYNRVAMLCATLVMGLAIGMTAPTHASDLVGPDIIVAYGDLAIDKEAGASQLLKRIEAAAARICEPLDRGSLASRGNVTKCRSLVTANAVHKVNHPMLLAVYNASRGAAPVVASLAK